MIAALRRDPTGALFLLAAVAAAALLWIERERVTEVVREIIPPPPPAVEAPDPRWLASARRGDVISVPGYEVAYWGRPDRTYFGTGLRPRAVVWHYPVASDPVGVIKHVTHRERGHRGYHFLIDQWGRIYQAAPLSRQTRHVKERDHSRRTGAFPWLDNSNSIGITIMDGCVRSCRTDRRPCPITQVQCTGERVSPAAQRAGLALAHALMARYSIPCQHITGHGELQTDRASVEGSTMTALLRAGCE